jgi:hypothetical protein
MMKATLLKFLKGIFLRYCLAAGAFLLSNIVNAQETKPSFSISGVAGISYEYYGLNTSPETWNGFQPRKPWNQWRFIFSPNISLGKLTLPFNFNFATKPTNFAGPYSGLTKQSFSQFITNPLNNFSLNPKYKWAELQLGTQYLNYSELSTGDIGIFGAGFDLRPGSYRFKFFTGVSQQAVNFFSGPSATGAFRRHSWMAQIGKEKEGKYSVAFNFVKAKDEIGSLDTVPPGLKPQEGFTLSLVTKVNIDKHWYVDLEGAQSIYTLNLNLPQDSSKPSFKPFIDPYASTTMDYAAQAGIGRKSQSFDISGRVKYIGAGFHTPGYPYMMPDRIDYTLNGRLTAWKNKMNLAASIGERVNNVSNTTIRASQFIGNINWFTQFDQHWSLNLSFNNFGFQSAGGINPYGIRNVSNDLNINPSFNWITEKASHIVTATYDYSRYDERDVITGLVTSNNTHSFLLSYLPSYFKSEINGDFSVLYFSNKFPGFTMKLITFSAGVTMPALKKKMNLRAQLQYNYSKNNSFTRNNNFIGSFNADWKATKKVTWSLYMNSNYFKYGNEISPIGANYLESNIRIGMRWRFGKI